MIITGLENDYYLSGNDIYIKVSGTSKESVYLDVDVTNATTGLTMGTLRPYPNALNEYKFNICLPVRALFPEPEGIVTPNSVQRMNLAFKATLVDGMTETISVSKLFVRGGRNKQAATSWNLTDGEVLTTAPFPKFIGVKELPNGVNQIQGDKLIEFVPKQRVDVLKRNVCKPTYVRFLNSLGGFEWWVFEQRVDSDESKAGKTKTVPTMKLKEDSVRQLATYQSRDISLTTDMPMEFHKLAVEMISSTEIYIFDPEAPEDDQDARFERVLLNGNNKIEKNTMTKKVKFELKLTLPTYVTREI